MIPIKDIIIGDRIREEMRDIDSLVYSIDSYGQLEPIVVTDAGNGKFKLLFGCRRITAFKKLNRTEIQARLFETLDEPTKVALELESDVRRENLTWAEKAKGVRRLVELKKQQHIASMPTRFAKQLQNKEIAEQLDMSPSALSEELKIADGLDKYPAIEFEAKTRTEALKMARDGHFNTILDKGLKQKAIEESFLTCTRYELLEQVENNTADLIILDPEERSNKLLKTAYSKLKNGGSIVVFAELIDIIKWTSFAESLNMYTLPPYIWHIKTDDLYLPFVWFGKHRERPLRLMPAHISAPRSNSAMHLKAKPYKLAHTIIKSCTEVGAFVLYPDCYSIEPLKACLDLERNIRASCEDKMLRDKLILNMN